MLPQALQQGVELRALHDLAVYGDIGLSFQRKGIKEPLIQLPAHYQACNQVYQDSQHAEKFFMGMIMLLALLNFHAKRGDRVLTMIQQ